MIKGKQSTEIERVKRMLLWFRRTKMNKIAVLPGTSAQETASIPSSVSEDTASAILHERKMNHWLDEAFRDCEKNGGFENLDGTGKRIEIPTGDPLAGILKNANYLPPWLELQHEIRDQLYALLRKYDHNRDPLLFETELASINKKIVRYNGLVPTPVLQKGRIYPELASQQLKNWE